MDFPEFEELQWLESHTLDDTYDEEYQLQIEPPSSPPSPPSPETDKIAKRPTLSIPAKQSPLRPHSQFNPTDKKRIRPNISKYFDIDTDYSDGKRIRIGEEEVRNEKWAQPDCLHVGPFEIDEVSGGPDARKNSLNGNLGLNNDGGACDEIDGGGRYSLPHPNEEKMEEVDKERGERMLSKFVSDIDGDCVPITGCDGERVYAKICRSGMDEERKQKLDVRESLSGLLAESVRIMMPKVEHEEFTKAVQASIEGPTEVVPSKAPVSEQLWVEKYAPSSFTELLSDEKTNREVLLWLKQWDLCVFGSEIKSTPDNVLSALCRQSLGPAHSKHFGKGNSGNSRETRFTGDLQRVHTELDKENNITLDVPDVPENRHKGSSPPEQKILLLCGSPGLGKTTLAHVAARHCGYHVVEINASDDRSTSTIKTKILDVVQMNSVVAGSKPKCLVIDEIDGALGDGKGAIDVILELISPDRKGAAGKDNAVQEAKSGQKLSKKKKRNLQLLRPVICICNDLYAPTLRPLRQVAKVHIFVQPSVSRVVNRLKYICNEEGARTNSTALSALAECTRSDIRSCLNTLQFLNKKKETLNVLDINSQVVGQKDVSKSVFDIWKEIFQRKRGKWVKITTNSGCCKFENFELLYSMISNRGDYDLILDGIHENMLQLHCFDPLMQKTVQCLDNLIVSDIFHQYIMRSHHMYLQVYQPSIAMLIHGLLAQPEKKNIEWPKSFHRYRMTLAERMDMLHRWHNNIPPHISRHLSKKSFVEDSISPLLHILSPPTLRPVALHLLSENEKSALWQLVNSMISYAISYKKTKSVFSLSLRQEEALDASILSLDPPLSDLVCFKDYKSFYHDLALTVKQVLVHEVEKQKIIQVSLSKSGNLIMKENHASAKNESGSALASICMKTNGKNPTVANSGCGMLSNSPQSGGFCSSVTEVKSMRIKKPSGGLTDFFHRFRDSNKEGSPDMKIDGQRYRTKNKSLHPFLFKFNEGFTNAVKRPVRMHEFFD